MQSNRPPTHSRSRLWWEVCIVLALSFGTSALYAIVNITERLTRETALSQQTATINRSLSERSWLDFIYQVLGICSGLAPVALVIWLTWRASRPHLSELGFGKPVTTTSNRWWIRESMRGVGLAALIGIPGIGFYLASKALGINATVVPTALDAHAWTVPVLLLAALKAALSEEVIVVAYLFNRLKKLNFSPVAIVISCALLRGTYHLYQGFGGFAGNVIMGLVFGWFYLKYGRVLPLIVAHFILDVVSFLGYPLAVALWPVLFGAPATV